MNILICAPQPHELQTDSMWVQRALLMYTITAWAQQQRQLCLQVQCGFGRVGSHFWGFELQSVVPDMVTLGKPIGNGFPMGAVIMSHQLAKGFSNGMEYFNTCGGCTGSAAAGQHLHATVNLLTKDMQMLLLSVHPVM